MLPSVEKRIFKYIYLLITCSLISSLYHKSFILISPVPLQLGQTTCFLKNPLKTFPLPWQSTQRFFFELLFISDSFKPRLNNRKRNSHGNVLGSIYDHSFSRDNHLNQEGKVAFQVALINLVPLGCVHRVPPAEFCS